jgi:hypothetical protein
MKVIWPLDTDIYLASVTFATFRKKLRGAVIVFKIVVVKLLICLVRPY